MSRCSRRESDACVADLCAAGKAGQLNDSKTDGRDEQARRQAHGIRPPENHTSLSATKRWRDNTGRGK